MSFLRIGFLSVILLALISACATEAPYASRLDSSGLTVSTLSEAIILARPVRTLAAGARDYAYIGPVEINRMGHRDYFLWIGLASTVDRELAGLVPANPVALILIVDEKPMILPLSAWDTRLDVSPYVGTAPVYAKLSAQTSLDQIHRIAAAQSVELLIVADTDFIAQYQTWEGAWTSWSEFPASD